MVVTVGSADTVAPVVVFNPVDGDQVYELAPLAVTVVVFPIQIAGELGKKVKLGAGLTVTTTVCDLEQPFAFVPVTV